MNGNGKSPRTQRHKFSKEEDDTLIRLVDVNGPRHWEAIAAFMPGRTGRQCRDRFMNYLMPQLSNDPWTDEEDRILELKYAELGTHWARYVPFLQGRSSNAIKNRWYTYHQRGSAAKAKSVSPEPEEKVSKSKPIVHIFERKGGPVCSISSSALIEILV